MKKGLIILITFFAICSVLKLQSQESEADSLLQLYEKAEQDTTKIQSLIDLGNFYIQRFPDSSLFFVNKSLEMINAVLDSVIRLDTNNNITISLLQKKAYCLRLSSVVMQNKGKIDLALSNIIEAKRIAYEAKDKKLIAISNIEIGNIYSIKSNYDSANAYYNVAMKNFEEIGDLRGIGISTNSIAKINKNKGNYVKAIEGYLKSIEIYERLDSKYEIAAVYMSIGHIYRLQKNYSQSLYYNEKALLIFKSLNNKKGLASIYSSIGILHSIQENFENALEYHFAALALNKEIGMKSSIGNNYINIGIAYKKMGNYDLAIKYYQESLNIYNKTNNLNRICTISLNLSNVYLKKYDSCLNANGIFCKKNLNYSIQYANKAYNLATQIDATYLKNKVAKALRILHTRLDNYQEALKYAEIYIETKDSMFSEEKTKALTEMTTRYEAEKTQLQIEKMEKQKELDDITIEAQQAKNRKQQIIIFSAVGGFLIVFVFYMIILRMFRQKRKANVLLAKQNDEINQQKEQIEEQNQNITDSIVYAQRIQRALLPPGDYMQQLLPYRFVFYKPRDIVSGDFYWVSKKDGLIITAAADCTGHGVPGAMMSMLGVSILNEILNTIKNLNAGEVLNSFRSKLIESLHQGGKETNMWDGIDTALCLIDLKKKQVEYAGANCPLYLIRDGELTETKGDKMPIGVHAIMNPFTNHTLKLQEGDTLYTFSDGYIDQFGGENDKRFTQRRFKKLLLDIHNKSMPKQEEELEKNLKEWQGITDQIDDILVMGVRV